MMDIQLHWPQMIWLATGFIGLGAHIVKHGEPTGAKYNYLLQLTRFGIGFALLYWGGFFNQAHAQVPPNATRYRADLVRAAHAQWGLNAPVAALAAQVHQESGWNPQAVSRVGAAGMAQFMPQTASWWCELNHMTAAECQPQNPTWALAALVGYDKWLYDRTPTQYTAFDRLWVALRAYNGGLGHWQAESRLAVNKSRQAVDAACGRARRSPIHCPENLGYPQRILLQLQPRYATWGPGV